PEGRACVHRLERDGELGGRPAAGIEVRLVERARVGGDDPDALVRTDHPLHERHEEEARGEERDVHAGGELGLEHRKEAAGGRDRADTRTLELLRRAGIRGEKRAIALPHDALIGRPVDHAKLDRELESHRVTDVSGEPREGVVHHEDPDVLAVGSLAATDEPRHRLTPNSRAASISETLPSVRAERSPMMSAQAIWNSPPGNFRDRVPGTTIERGGTRPL